MAARNVGTRPMDYYKTMIPKLHAAFGLGVSVGKGASRDKPRVPVGSAEAGTPSPGSGNTLIEHLEGIGDLGE